MGSNQLLISQPLASERPNQLRRSLQTKQHKVDFNITFGHNLSMNSISRWIVPRATAGMYRDDYHRQERLWWSVSLLSAIGVGIGLRHGFFTHGALTSAAVRFRIHRLPLALPPLACTVSALAWRQLAYRSRPRPPQFEATVTEIRDPELFIRPIQEQAFTLQEQLICHLLARIEQEEIDEPVTLPPAVAEQVLAKAMSRGVATFRQAVAVVRGTATFDLRPIAPELVDNDIERLLEHSDGIRLCLGTRAWQVTTETHRRVEAHLLPIEDEDQSLDQPVGMRVGSQVIQGTIGHTLTQNVQEAIDQELAVAAGDVSLRSLQLGVEDLYQSRAFFMVKMLGERGHFHPMTNEQLAQLKRLSQLEALDLWIGEEQWNDALELLEGLPNIKQLRIYSQPFMELSAEKLSVLASKRPNIEELSFSTNSNEIRNCLTSIGDGLHELRHLVIHCDGPETETLDDLSQLALGCPNLAHLGLIGQVNISSSTVATLIESAPTIRSLDAIVIDLPPQLWATHLRLLDQLNFWSGTHFIPSLLQGIHAVPNNLRFSKLSTIFINRNNLSKVCELLNKCPYLESADLNIVDTLSPAQATQLAESLPKGTTMLVLGGLGWDLAFLNIFLARTPQIRKHSINIPEYLNRSQVMACVQSHALQNGREITTD